MDFTQRGSQPQTGGSAGSSEHSSGGRKSKRSKFSLFRIATVVLLFSATILVVALLASLIIGGPKSESKYVKNDRLQAVFLNGGQVYFGHIASLNDRFVRMTNIYYLRVNQTVQPDQKANQTANNDVSLVKLGCELHGPEDEMVINSEQVVFWENLKTDGQVAKAVETYVKQNPNGQQCNTNTTSTNDQNSNN